MRRIAVILILLFCAAAFAQKHAVVVGAVGEDPKPGLGKALEAQVKEAFVKDGRYTAITRGEAVLAMVDGEQAHQRSGAVDNAQIRQIGKQSGAKYICVVEASPLLDAYALSAQFIDIETANIVQIANVTSALKNTDEFHSAAKELIGKLLGESPDKPNIAAVAPPQKNKSSKVMLTLRLSSAALAAGGIAGGYYFNDKADKEYNDVWKKTKNGSQEEKDSEKKISGHETNRNILYTLGGIGLAGFAVTFFF